MCQWISIKQKSFGSNYSLVSTVKENESVYLNRAATPEEDSKFSSIPSFAAQLMAPTRNQ